MFPGQGAQDVLQTARKSSAIGGAPDPEARRFRKIAMIGDRNIGCLSCRPNELLLREPPIGFGAVEHMHRAALQNVRADLLSPAAHVARRRKAPIADKETDAREQRRVDDFRRQMPWQINDNVAILRRKFLEKRRDTFRCHRRVLRQRSKGSEDMKPVTYRLHSPVEKQLVDSVGKFNRLVEGVAWQYIELQGRIAVLQVEIEQGNPPPSRLR